MNVVTYYLTLPQETFQGSNWWDQWPKRGANLGFSEWELLEIFGKKLGSVTHFWHRKHRKFRYFIENSPNFVKVEAFIA